MTAPTFSVLLPSRDRPDLLRFAIESVRRQSFEDYEIIVSDNASKAPYADMLAAIGDARIRCFRIDRGVPVTENWSRCLSKARGEYVVMLGDDDALAPGYFETMLAVIEEFGEPDVIHSAGYHYCYPGAVASAPDGFLAIVRNGPLLIDKPGPYLLPKSDAVMLAQRAMNFHLSFGLNSQHFLWRRDRMPTIARNDDFFKSPYPDYYSSLMTFLNAETIVVQPQPMVLIGISPKSFGFYFSRGDEQGGAALLGHNNEELFRGVIGVLPGSDLNSKWLMAVQDVQSSQVGVRDLKVGLANYRRLQIVECVRRAELDGDPSSLEGLRGELRPAETAFCLGLRLALKTVRIGRPQSRGALVMHLADRALNQHFPAVVTHMALGPHESIIDAIDWLEEQPP